MAAGIIPAGIAGIVAAGIIPAGIAGIVAGAAGIALLPAVP
jgi:hypothetical protein